MKKQHLLNIALLTSIGIAATPVLSGPVQGTLGETSEGKLDVLLELGKVIQISKLDDINFNTVTPDANTDLVKSDEFCVYSNSVVGTYKITSTSTQGANTGTDFAMKHSSKDDTLPYTLTMNGKPLTSGIKSSNSFTANGTAFDCGNSTNATLEATVLAADLASRPAGKYSDTLTLLVTPD